MSHHSPGFIIGRAVGSAERTVECAELRTEIRRLRSVLKQIARGEIEDVKTAAREALK